MFLNNLPAHIKLYNTYQARRATNNQVVELAIPKITVIRLTHHSVDHQSVTDGRQRTKLTTLQSTSAVEADG